MTDPAAQAGLLYLDFANKYLPDLFKFVVPIVHQGENGREYLGSGVLVNTNDRHFIASARHCIERDPRPIIGDDFFVERNRIVPKQTVREVRRDWHQTLDIGFIEILPLNLSSLNLAEVHRSQFSSRKIVEGMVHVIGHPKCLSDFNVAQRHMIITKAAFGTNLLDETDECLTFAYPVLGVRFNPEIRSWETGPFPVTPHGFSGGACFGVEHTVQGTKSPIEKIEYNLLGIQCEWDANERSVSVVPIKQWCDFLRQSCGIN